MSTAAIGRTPSYLETVQSGDLAQDSSSVMQTRRASAPSNTLNIAELETVPLMTHSPHTPVYLLSEHNFPATGSSHHRDSSWDVESTTSILHTESTDRSAFTANRERTEQFLAESVTVTDSATKNPVSQTEITVSSDQTQFPSQATQSRGGSTPDSLVRIVLTHSYLSPNTTAEGGDHLRSNSSTEQIIFSSQTGSVSVLDASDRSGGRTLQTLIDISHSHNATQTSLSSSNEMSSSLGRTHSSYVWTPEQTSGINLSPGDMEFTETTLVHSQAHSETTDDRNNQHTSTVEKRDTHTQTDSTSSSDTLFRDRVGTLEVLTNRSKPAEATEINEMSSSLGRTHSSYVWTPEQTSGINLSPGDMEFTETTLIHSQAHSETTDVKNKHHTFSTSNTGERGPQTESTFSSVASIRGGNGTLEALTNSSRFTEATSLSTFESEGVSSSDVIQYSSVTVETGRNPSSSKETHFTETSDDPLLRYSPKTSNYSPSTMDLSKTEEQNVSLSEGQFTEHSTEHLPEHSSLVPIYASSSEDPSTVGSGLHKASSSGTEMRASHSYADTMSSSVPFSSEEGRTLQPVMNTTFIEVTESSSSYMEKSSASELNHSLSGMYSEMTDFSGKDLDISGPSTESAQNFTSSRITTYSSFQSEPSDTENEFQTMDSTNTGKRSSASHTDSTYISTPITKGGERTLLSIPNNSTSFYAEFSVPSESAQSTFSITQNIGSNSSSSDRDFSALSTEPLDVQSLQTTGYSSTTVINSTAHIIPILVYIAFTGFNILTVTAWKKTSKHDRHNVRITYFGISYGLFSNHKTSQDLGVDIHVLTTGQQFKTHCKHIDECLSNPCPALASCTNTQGSFQCACSLGYRMEKGKCNLVRTFVGQFPLTFNTTGGKYSELRQIEEDIMITLNSSLSALPGYYTSTVQASRQSGIVQVSITSTFSVVSNVTLYDVVSTVRSHIRACKASSETCQFMSSLLQLHR
ncbi:UNVERIFIED_CONTAM: hypothetical protein K2H54_022508, partial [Gekko kuhli]